MAWETWLLFCLTGLGIAITPGPNGLLALTHGALHGRRMTVWTIAGGSSGLVVLMALCMFGVGALIKASLWWFTALKVIGGAYLVWLGIQVWLSPPITLAATGVAETPSGMRLFRTGFLTAVTNPKGLLFFSALLPQFIDPQRSIATQFAVMAVSYGVIEFAIEYVFAATANRMSAWLARAGRRFNRFCGGVFVLVGLAMPLR